MQIFNEKREMITECELPKILLERAYIHDGHMIVPISNTTMPNDIWEKLWGLEYPAMETASVSKGLEMLPVYLFNSDLVFDVTMQESGTMTDIVLRCEMTLSGYEETHLMCADSSKISTAYTRYCKEKGVNEKYYPSALECDLPTFSVAMTPEEALQIGIIPHLIEERKAKKGGGRKCRK